MKILWVKSDLLHPTTKGGHIRTLEMLKRVSTRHEVHYAAFEEDPASEGKRLSREYCSRVYTVPHRPPPRTSRLLRRNWRRASFRVSPSLFFAIDLRRWRRC